ncbi:hypothetical protein R1flu_008150 [Riccia fluitans]|uniref:Uncharacterized protein n=1 Tax=Riccia fluitans TaxID=41844 RepID=A0ABD1YB27_9MARC
MRKNLKKSEEERPQFKEKSEYWHNKWLKLDVQCTEKTPEELRFEERQKKETEVATPAREQKRQQILVGLLTEVTNLRKQVAYKTSLEKEVANLRESNEALRKVEECDQMLQQEAQGVVKEDERQKAWKELKSRLEKGNLGQLLRLGGKL